MPKPIKLLVLLSNREPPSSRLRFRACAAEFQRHGIQADFIPICVELTGLLRLFLLTRKYDAVVLQKKTSLHRIFLAFLKSCNANLVFDYDDAVMFHELEHGKPLRGKNFKKFLRTINHCRAAVAGNSFLADFARPNCPSVHVLPTPVDTEIYRLKEQHGSLEAPARVIVGWLGAPGNLKYLREIAPALGELSARFPEMTLKIISTASISLEGVRVEYKKWRLAEEIDDLCSLDIGIMPLEDSLWGRGKCGYKILQYMGVGVPVAASPVGVNIEYIKHGDNGFLAAGNDEWVDCLAALIQDPTKRRAVGLAGRRTIEERYSLRAYTAEYSRIVKSLVSG